MSSRFLLSVVAAVAVVSVARLLLDRLPFAALAKRWPLIDAVVTTVGLLGLLFHCSAMFFRGAVDAIPGARGPVQAVDALGTFSIAWYVVSALLVLTGLLRLHWSGPVAVGVTLIAVGSTMYGRDPLAVHLTTIFAAVVVLTVVAATLVTSPTGPFGRITGSRRQPAGR